jgi:hypothetical protein
MIDKPNEIAEIVYLAVALLISLVRLWSKTLTWRGTIKAYKLLLFQVQAGDGGLKDK